MKRAKHGFTLIELLVVMAITSLLLTMIGAGLSKAKGSAKNVLCVSNMKQLGLASQMYWDDNAQRTFPYLTSRDMDGAVYWFGWLGAGQEGSRDLDRSRGAIWSYLGGDGIQVCPSFRYQDPLYKPKAIFASHGYGYNLHLTQSKAGVNRYDAQGQLMTQLPSPSNTALFADSAQINDFQAPASRDQPLIEEFYYINHGPALYANGHFRHNGQAETVFCDGHVSSEAPEDGTIDVRLPNVGIARLRIDILVP
jgi:prepilin-type N-terminal cleavage/methylation domain-containing protein/prepilin-type processing-associated H-X9-DG protein